MRKTTGWIAAIAAVGLVGAASAADQAGGKQAATGRPAGVATDARTVIEDWPATAKKAADAMLEKYGEPDGVMEQMLLWEDTGPWKRTIVYKEEIQHDFPVPHKDVLEQFVNFDVPEDKFDELARYDGSVIAERTKGELSARCDQEAANFLAINLAQDVIQGKKTVKQARTAYGNAVKALMRGEKPAITQSFQFEVARQDITNPDESIIDVKPVRGEEVEERVEDQPEDVPIQPQRGAEEEPAEAPPAKRGG